MPFKVVGYNKEVDASSLLALKRSMIDLVQWTTYELQQVASALVATDADQVWNTTPPKPRRGTYAYADGTNWNPGSGEGPYFFNGTTWTPMKDTTSSKAVTAKVRLNASQALTGGTATKILFDTVMFDATSCWDATNHWFKPQVAGTYLVTLGVSCTGTFTVGTSVIESFIGKNGIYTGGGGANSQGSSFQYPQAGAGQIATLSTLVQMNGTTDTVEGDVLCPAGTTPSVQATALPNLRTHMSIARVGT